MTELRVLNTLDVPWGAALVLIAAGMTLLVFGSRWRDFTEVFSGSMFGGGAALLLLPPLAVNPIWPIVGACLFSGMLMLVFRRVAVVILTGLVLGLSLSVIVHLLAGWTTQPYYVWSLSSDQVMTIVLGPDYLGSSLLLSLLVGGILLGVILALAAPNLTRRIAMGLQGGLALLVGAALVSSEFFSTHLPAGYPMQYLQAAAIAWLGLAALAVVVQNLVDKSAAARASADRPQKDTQ